MKLVGMDVGSTTVKAIAVEWRAAAEGEASGYNILWQDYQRHNTRQAEKVLEFLGRMEEEAQVVAGRDRVFFTGSGAGLLGPLVGAKMIQEVVAVAACVERLHPDVRFVSEIGGEDMKTIFFTATGTGRSKQVYMQSACSGGTGTFIEKTTLTKGNTPAPEVLLLGGPNLFFKGLQEAWRHHLGKLWEQRKLVLPEGRDPASLITVPAEALYYACLGCVEIGAGEAGGVAVYEGRDRLRWWVEEGQQEEKAKAGGRALVACAEDLTSFVAEFDLKRAASARGAAELAGPVLVGCDFGSTTAKAVVLSPTRELLFTCYALSKGNPIEDAQSLFRQVREAGYTEVDGLALTGYGKDLLRDVVGADVAVVETVAHATGTLHFHPDADVICDVGGTDVKIMILRQGTVADFRLNSQCSSGNGAFLQGVAERYAIPLEAYAEKAFEAKAMPTLAMGCGVFLQSDIVNQQRKGWAAEEIMAALAAVLPVNVWIYAGQLQNLRSVGRKFVLQGGTHRNMAVVKAQVDFIRGKVPEADVVLHPYSGEAGAIGAALCAADWRAGGAGRTSRFRGFEAIAALTYTSTTAPDTVCKWCPINCTRTFIDVQLPGAKGRPWSKLPLAAGWERVISGNSCPKGLVEDVNELREVKAKLEEVKRDYPNVAEMVRKDAFRRSRAGSEAVAG